MLRFIRRLAGGAVLAGLALGVCTPASAGSDADNPFKHFGELTEKSEHITGFLDLHKKRDTVYLEIPVGRLGEPMLLISTLSRGIGTAGLFGGMPLHYFDGIMVQFERRGDRIHLVQLNHRFRADANTPEARAVELSYTNSVLASLKIESERYVGDEVGVAPKKDEKKEDAAAADSTAEGSGDLAEAEADDEAETEPEEPKELVSVVVDFSSVLLSDLSNVTESMNSALDASYGLDGDRSYIERISVYPENAEFNMALTFKTGKDPGLESVIDSRYVTLGIHHSFSKLPEVPMVPRYADDRVGFFTTVYKDFSREQEKEWFVRLVNRWRLEKKNPNQAVSDPIKPIVYTMENTIPKEYRPYIKKGVESWQKAFEAAGFSNAIIAVDQPDDPEWSAEDVRYSTLRWITSHNQSFGAIGPSRTDPRTGEILDADILIEAGMIQGFRNAYQRVVSPDAAGLPGDDGFAAQLEADRDAYLAAYEAGGAELASMLCSASNSLPTAGAFLQAALIARGDLAAGEPIPEEYIGEALFWVTAHEVGHTLGLRHNFRSSAAVPFDKLNDKAYVAKNGLYGSVMEYPSINVSANRSAQGYYYTPCVGTYDVWAIRYGYTPFKGVRDPRDETKQIAAIASESANPLHAFGTDEEWYLPGSVDPHVNTGDLSDNPLAFAKDRTSYVASLLAGLEMRMVESGASWSDLTVGFNTLLSSYYGSMNYISRYVGGMSTSRAHKGDPGATAPMIMLEAATQRDAIAFLASSLFSADPLPVSNGYLEHLEPNRWGHWGSNMSARLDYPYYGRVLALQEPIVRRLTSPFTLARVLESELYQPNAFTLVELFETLNGAIWTEVIQPANGGGIPTIRRGAQRMWLDRMIEIAFLPENGMPADARAVARMNLLELSGKIDAALGNSGALDGYSKAHLLDCRARIATAMDAGYQLEIMKGG